MKILRSAILILSIAGAALAGTVNSALLNLVMPDAVVLSGAQVDQLAASPFGQYLLSQFQPTNSGFLDFVGATGFDPRYNLQYVLAATSVDGAGTRNGLILGVGTFVPSKIITAATDAGASTSTYKGITILTAPKSSKQNSLAFLDSSTIVAGNLAMVQAAIDRRLAGSVFSGALAQQASSVSGAYQAWYATVTPLSDFLTGKIGNLGNLSQNNLFQSILESSGGVNFTASGVTVTADAVTASPQNAQSVVDVLQFLVSMMQNNNGNNPKLGALAGASTFSVNGSTAHLVLALSEQQAEQLVTPPTGKAVVEHRERVRK